ncbi:MAG: hypothetical protein NC483_07560, partial [Ruminococcus sp.]|nr:hypothetical protein [Ruminococcus sp.]
MAYTREELTSLSGDTNIKSLREKVVSINLFDNVEQIDLNSSVLRQIDYTSEIYEEYIGSLKAFPTTSLQLLLASLKQTEIIDNHCLELRNRDMLMSSYNQNHHSSAINYLVRRLFTDNV